MLRCENRSRLSRGNLHNLERRRNVGKCMCTSTYIYTRVSAETIVADAEACTIQPQDRYRASTTEKEKSRFMREKRC